MQSYHLYVGQLESLSLSLSLYFWSKHVYVQVVIVAHIFPWFYFQLPLAPVRDINFSL